MNIGNILGMFNGGNGASGMFSGGSMFSGDEDFSLVLALVLLLASDSNDRVLIFALIYILM